MKTKEQPSGQPLRIPLYGGPLDGETHEFPNDHLFSYIPAGHTIKFLQGDYVVMMDGRAHYQASKESKR